MTSSGSEKTHEPEPEGTVTYMRGEGSRVPTAAYHSGCQRGNTVSMVGSVGCQSGLDPFRV